MSKSISLRPLLYSGLAQLVEQLTVNQFVAGSSPASGVQASSANLFAELFFSLIKITV
jgi:hypothetical protein